MVDEIDYWFEAGWAVFKDEQWDADSFPPSNDMEAQRWWLGVATCKHPCPSLQTSRFSAQIN